MTFLINAVFITCIIAGIVVLIIMKASIIKIIELLGFMGILYIITNILIKTYPLMSNYPHNNVKNNQKENNNSSYTEEDMDVYNLSEEERKEVRNGNYNPEDFEEDGDLEDDDYYYEDS